MKKTREIEKETRRKREENEGKMKREGKKEEEKV